MKVLGLHSRHWLGLVGVLLVLGLAMAYWPSPPPPPEIRTDMLRMRNGDWLQGRLRLETLSIDTPYGRIEFPIHLIQSVATTADANAVDVLLTTGGDRFSGRVMVTELDFDPAAGTSLRVPVEQISELTLGNEAQTSLSLPDWQVTMRNGDHFHVALDTTTLSLATSYGRVEVRREEMLHLAVEKPDNLIRINLRHDRGEIRGELLDGPLILRTVADQTLSPDLERMVDITRAGVTDSPETVSNFRMPDDGSDRDHSPFHDTLPDGNPGPVLVVIPAGHYLMGPPINPPGHAEDSPALAITIERSFAIGIHEVTFEQYDRFARATGRDLPRDQDWGRDERPVIHVSWQDAMAYADWLSEQTGARYRLPTEAEWEYTARAGSRSFYWWGDTIGRGMANCDGCNDPPVQSTAPVGSYPVNAFGLHDVLGNVWEWICSRFDEHLEAQAHRCAERDDLSLRAIRGGSWFNKPSTLGVSVRDTFAAQDSGELVGFRLVREL